MSNEISIYWSNRSEKDKGKITVKTKRDKYYFRKYLYSDLCFSSKESAYKAKRYIQWVDTNNFICCSRRNVLSSLNGSRLGDYRSPIGFDHTSQWRRIGDRDPILTLTEPYAHVDFNKFQEHADHYKLSFKAFEPSPKSLWYPNSTCMIFFWNPKKFDFDESMLMGHPDSEYVC